jgi:hypothetical protein
MTKTWSNKCAPANRRYASPLGAGRQFGRAFPAQTLCSPAPVAELSVNARPCAIPHSVTTVGVASVDAPCSCA